MELIAFLLMWPILIIIVGLVFVSVHTLGFLLPSVVLFIFLYFFIKSFRRQDVGVAVREKGSLEQLEEARRSIITFSIAVLLPVFVKYLINSTSKDAPLAGIILALVIGFGAIMLGMFVRNNKILTFSNVIGGVIVVAYAYYQIWHLDDLAKIIATAFGLAVAVAIAIIKLKDKLS